MMLETGNAAYRESRTESPCHGSKVGIFEISETVLASIAAGAANLDESGEHPVVEFDILRRAGWLAEAGVWAQSISNNGKNSPSLPILIEALRGLGRANLSIARIFEGHFNALYLACRYGTPAQARRAADDARRGLLFAVWNAERENGVTVTRQRDGIVVAGRKWFASGAGLVQRPLVTARDGDGQTFMVIVPLPEQPLSACATWTAAGMRASVSGVFDFEGFEIDEDTIIGDAGQYFAQPAFSAGAWRFTAGQLGAIEALRDQLALHLAESGRGSDAMQQARFAQAAIATETARLWVFSAAFQAEDQGADPDQRVAYVNLARHAVERAALDVIEAVQRSIGLGAFLKPHPVERIVRDLSVYLRQPAPDRALLTAAQYTLENGKAETL